MTRRLPAISALAAAGILAAAAASQTAAQSPPADERTTVFTFTGRGWGHGVGMSQYGARGRALAGWSAARILRHYYRGARLSRAPARSVRVLLAPNLRRAVVWSPGAWRATGPRAAGRGPVPLRPGAVHRVRSLPGGRVAVERAGRRVALFTGPARFRAAGRDGWVAWGPRRAEDDRRYRGALAAVPRGGAFAVVNTVGLEDYLTGVVPREMPSSWGDDAPAALAVQAVAARSYALATMRPTDLFDVYDDQRSQVYGGVDAEDPRATRAVRATRGTVLTHGGAVITAFFFSTSGGRTEDVENVFGGAPLPYLRSVADPFDRGSPYHVWPDPPSFTAAGLGRALGLGEPVEEVVVLRRGRSPRVMSAAVTTRAGRRVVLTGASMRSSLGLRDTWFEVTRREVPAAEAARLVGA